MAGRRERCNGCGVQLVVPPKAQIIRCSVCQGVTHVNRTSINPYIQASHDSINQAADLFKSLMTTVITTVPFTSTGHPFNHQYHYQPPQPSVPKPLMPPSQHGRKRAVLCGVSYRGRRDKLKGTVNDVQCMRYFLVDRLGFPNDSILMLTEYENDPFKIPTKQNIRLALQWLVQGCQSGDSLVFHFSGHGSRQLDYKMDEIDGYDETLCPVDYETQGTILDDEINATIVRPLPHGAKLHAIIDACHSGTVLDLPFVCRINREGYYKWEDHRRSHIYKGTSGGLAVSISACDDHQTSSDTTALSGYISTGALTYSFIQAMENDPGLTYGYLLNVMRQIIREARTGIRLKGPIAALVNKVLRTGLSQTSVELQALSRSEISVSRTLRKSPIKASKVVVAEALTVLDGCIFAKQLGLNKVIVELDSKETILCLRKSIQNGSWEAFPTPTKLLNWGRLFKSVASFGFQEHLIWRLIIWRLSHLWR